MDRLLHVEVFGASGPAPPYSTDEALAKKVKTFAQSKFGIIMITGVTRFRSRRFFARYETDPSDATEVLAETLPLAIWRLALLRARKQSFYKS